MAASVLGKRSRTVADVADAPARSTRAKKRVCLDNVDENTNPFSTTGHVKGCRDVEMDGVLKKTESERRVPAKHGKPGQRVPISSPAKISGRFKTSKTTVDVFQDCKDDQPPITPRHRDAATKKVAVTPRHRLIVASTQSSPQTPRTPSNGSTAVYTQARRLFSRCTNPGMLIGRDTERSELIHFVEQGLKSQNGTCLYVSGPPGTGKSALVDEVCQKYSGTGQLKISTVNCMSVRNAKDLGSKLAIDLDLQENVSISYLRSCFLRAKDKSQQQYLIILDEIDRLVGLDLALLYSLFELAMQPVSRLMLIGIANALDLTDRFLPRLKSRNLKPELLPFMPYTAAQIADVLTAKLKTIPGSEELQMPPFLHPTAIQFCAKKVAAQTGDLRKAFDICRRAIDLIDQDTRAKDATKMVQDSPSKTPLMENINLSSPLTPRSPTKSPPKQCSPIPVYTLATAPRATIAHMAKITAQVFSNGASQRLNALNLQQKAVLCSLVALEKRKRNAQMDRVMFATPSKTDRSAPTINQLYNSYTSRCKKSDMLQPLSSVEFKDVVSGLETLGLVANADGKNGSFALPITPSRTPSRKSKGGFSGVATGDSRRVSSAVGEKEVRGVLDGVGGELLREILDGDC